GATERGGRRPGGSHELRNGQAGSYDLALKRSDVLRIDQLVVDGWNRVLPDELLSGDLRAEIPRPRTHVAVGQLEPCPGEGLGELIRIFHEASRDFFVDR